MLNRPGFLLRRLISHARPRTENEGGDQDSCGEEESVSASNAIQKKRRSKTWAPVSSKKTNASQVTVRKLQSAHRISSPLPPVPALLNESYSSSSLSLCSCDGHTDGITRLGRTNPRASSALCLTEHGAANTHSNPPKRPPRPRNALFSVDGTSTLSAGNSPRPSLSLSDPSADPPAQGPDTSTCLNGDGKQAMVNSEPIESLEHPENPSKAVPQASLEKDEALKAAGSAPAEATNSLSRQICDDSNTNASTTSLAIKTHSTLMPSTTGLEREQKSRDGLSPAVLGSPARNASIKKTKKTAMRFRYGGPRSGKPTVRMPKWTLSENMTEILTGQRFRRVEADEMLTPDQIEALRRTREQAQLNEERLKPQRKSSDSGRSINIGTTETATLEPFHRDDLPFQSGGGTSGVERTIMTTEPIPSSIPPGHDVLHADFSVQSKSKATTKDEGSAESPEPKMPLNPKTSALPSLPKKASRRSKKQKGKLQTIPEVMVTTPDNTQLQPSANRLDVNNTGLGTEQDDEFFYLKSTPFTLTKPGFRHGPITFSKAEMCKGIKTMDDTLDWTAFQMAILGGAGDLFPDTSMEEDKKQAEDIASWFESFGFETSGKLIPAAASCSPRDSAQSTLSSSPSTVDTEAEPPIPVGAEFPSGFWNVSGEDNALRFGQSGGGLKRWIAEERPQRYASTNPESPPLSPMMPLVAGDGEGHVLRETVPMGYNLGHDLGDFLQWEAQHAYAGGFYGA